MFSRAAQRVGLRGESPRRLVFIAGLSLAVLAFALMLGIGLNAIKQNAAGGQTVTIVTASRDIAQREVLTDSMLTLSQVSATAVPTGAITRISDASGAVALVRIMQSQAIATNLIAKSTDQISSAGSAYLPIPQGYVARSLPTSEELGVAGYIAAGDYINIVATIQTAVFGQSPSRFVTRTIFTNTHVIRVGPLQQSDSRSGAIQGVSTSITVIVTECDAEVLDWFLASGARVTFSLLSYKDYGTQPTAPNASCPSSTTGQTTLGPAEVDSRFGFTKA